MAPRRRALNFNSRINASKRVVYSSDEAASSERVLRSPEVITVSITRKDSETAEDARNSKPACLQAPYAGRPARLESSIGRERPCNPRASLASKKSRPKDRSSILARNSAQRLNQEHARVFADARNENSSFGNLSFQIHFAKTHVLAREDRQKLFGFLGRELAVDLERERKCRGDLSVGRYKILRIRFDRVDRGRSGRASPVVVECRCSVRPFRRELGSQAAMARSGCLGSGRGPEYRAGGVSTSDMSIPEMTFSEVAVGSCWLIAFCESSSSDSN